MLFLTLPLSTSCATPGHSQIPGADPPVHPVPSHGRLPCEQLVQMAMMACSCLGGWGAQHRTLEWKNWVQILPLP